jgi:hypothetical protein
MGFTTTGKNAMLDALGVTLVSAHTADPGETGTSEVTGGTYARKSITYSAASAGALDSSNIPELDIPAGVTVTHLGYWAGTDFVASSALAAAETFANAGKLTVTDSDLSIT